MKKKEKLPEEVREALTEETAPEATLPEAGSPAEAEQAPAANAPEGQDRLASDVALFHELFPEVKAQEIPGEVWDKVEAGESLAGAYAVYFVKALRDRERIERVNAENEKAAPPRVRHDGTDGSYFSPDAVRAMTREEVRKNYREILRSMDHWN